VTSDPRIGPARISRVLDRLRTDFEAPRLSLGDLLDALGDHGFGLMILVLALFNAIPTPHIPGYSLVFAPGFIVLGVQLAMGRRTPQIPERVRRWSVSRAGFTRFLDRVLPWIERIERWLMPRPSWLTDVGGGRLIGVAVILLSMVLALPVPFGNVPVAWALIVLALGLMEEDSRALAWGLALGILTIAWNAALITGGAFALVELVDYFE
jgi:hypothetical protein